MKTPCAKWLTAKMQGDYFKLEGTLKTAKGKYYDTYGKG